MSTFSLDPLIEPIAQAVALRVQEILAEEPRRDLLSPAEIAERTGISKSKVYDMLNRGDMRSVKIDGQKRVPVEDYLFWRRSLPTS